MKKIQNLYALALCSPLSRGTFLNKYCRPITGIDNLTNQLMLKTNQKEQVNNNT